MSFRRIWKTGNLKVEHSPSSGDLGQLKSGKTTDRAGWDGNHDAASRLDLFAGVVEVASEPVAEVQSISTGGGRPWQVVATRQELTCNLITRYKIATLLSISF